MLHNTERKVLFENKQSLYVSLFIQFRWPMEITTLITNHNTLTMDDQVYHNDLTKQLHHPRDIPISLRTTGGCTLNDLNSNWGITLIGQVYDNFCSLTHYSIEYSCIEYSIAEGSHTVVWEYSLGQLKLNKGLEALPSRCIRSAFLNKLEEGLEESLKERTFTVW